MLMTTRAEEFNELVAKAIDQLPSEHRRQLTNVVFIVEDIPSDRQRQELSLRHDQTLFGLYQGVPLPVRGGNTNLIPPDKITIFRRPLEAASQTMEQLWANIKHTVWHEVGHYYGLDHKRIYELEAKNALRAQ
jgi:predicted Zn-dependent protease with MMP-like domain